jgi:anti-sigma B factor antagonist
MSSFEVAPERGANAHAWLLTASGAFDTAATRQFDRTLDDAIGHGARLVTVDMVGVSFLDSSGVRSLVAGGKRLDELGGRMTVTGLSGAAQRVLEISGLIDRLTAGPVDDT